MRTEQATRYISLSIGSQTGGEIKVRLARIQSYHILCRATYITSGIFDSRLTNYCREIVISQLLIIGQDILYLPTVATIHGTPDR